jgi:hypothetical protein
VYTLCHAAFYGVAEEVSEPRGCWRRDAHFAKEVRKVVDCLDVFDRSGLIKINKNFIKYSVTNNEILLLTNPLAEPRGGAPCRSKA